MNPEPWRIYVPGLGFTRPSPPPYDGMVPIPPWGGVVVHPIFCTCLAESAPMRPQAVSKYVC